jgi:hypothetical protein
MNRLEEIEEGDFNLDTPIELGNIESRKGGDTDLQIMLCKLYFNVL